MQWSTTYWYVEGGRRKDCAMEHYLLVCGGREEEGLCNGALLTGMWREGGGRTVQSRTGDGFSCGEETASSSNIFTSPSFIKHNIIIS